VAAGVCGVVYVFVWGRNPFRVVMNWGRFPRVARCSQPWALLGNPFGILRLPACLGWLADHDVWVMPKRRLIWLLLCLGVGAVLTAALFRSHDPVYEGKNLTEWFKEITVGSDLDRTPAARNAIRAMGTNALPTLMKWIDYEPSGVRMKVNRMYAWLFRRAPGARLRGDYESRRADWAIWGLKALGPDAGAGIVDLNHILTDTNRDRSVWRAAGVLGSLGELGTPVLMTGLTNQDARVRMLSLLNVGRSGTNASRAVPALLNLLEDRSPTTRNMASNAIRQIDPNALKFAVPPREKPVKTID